MGSKKYIQEIMDEFDFDRVHEVMKHLDWKWYMGDYSTYVPTVRQIKERVFKQLNEVKEEAKSRKCNTIIATGGFESEAFYNKDTGKVDYFTLKFVVEEWEAGKDD